MSFDVEHEIKQIKDRLDALEMMAEGTDYEVTTFHDFKEAFLKEFDKLVDLIEGFRDNLRDS